MISRIVKNKKRKVIARAREINEKKKKKNCLFTIVLRRFMRGLELSDDSFSNRFNRIFLFFLRRFLFSHLIIFPVRGGLRIAGSESSVFFRHSQESCFVPPNIKKKKKNGRGSSLATGGYSAAFWRSVEQRANPTRLLPVRVGPSNGI
jgi:hypothetical protein